jgi:predicted ATPase/transcriptional regulator with XRE-family HTH domain
MSDTISFGRWLKRLRKAHDLTQADLARRVGCAEVTIQKIETGVLRPSRQIASRLADHLGLDSEERAAFVQAARAEGLASPLEPSPAVLAAPTSSSPQRPTQHLPIPATPLIGRAAHAAAARDLLTRADTRLLTLLGPPGIGKTRLSIQVAADLAGAFADGVWFVALAPIGDPDLVATTIAQTLEVESRGDRPLVAQLKEYLRDRQLLLVLDNVEQVVAAAPLIAELLASVAGLKVLATSRVALRVYGEREFLVPPLARPPQEASKKSRELESNAERADLRISNTGTVGAQPSIPSLAAAIAQYPAVELFVQRAQAIRPEFVLTETNAVAVAALSARLDGLPLAIELAAARSKIFSPEELLARLEGCSPGTPSHGAALDVLVGGARDMPPRQQTLRAAIDWSYQLLSPSEQALFARLGVFVGGWTLAVVSEVLSSELRVMSEESRQLRIHNSELKTLAGLESLLDNSLLQQEWKASGERRFSMLETIREYALERLAESRTLEDVRQQHATYFLRLVEAASSELWGAEQRAWLDRLEAEHDNIRATLAYCLEARDLRLGACDQHDDDTSLKPQASSLTEIGLHLAGSLVWFWHFRGYWSEGRRWLEGLLEQSRDAQPPTSAAARANALFGAGALAWAQRDYEVARTRLTQCIALVQPVPDGWIRAHALGVLGLVAIYEGNSAAAVEPLAESLDLFQHTEDPAGIALTLIRQGIVAEMHGNWAAAVAQFEQGLALFRSTGSRWGIATALANLGDAAQMQGDWERSAALYRESLPYYYELGSKWYVANALVSLAYAIGRLGDWARAVRLLGAVEALLEAIGMRLHGIEGGAYDACRAGAFANLDGASYTAAWTAGWEMTVEQAIEYVLD